MKIKQEVKDLCMQLRNAETGSEEFKRVQKILQEKYKFSTFALLALFYREPIIEYESEQIPLIAEECFNE